MKQKGVSKRTGCKEVKESVVTNDLTNRRLGKRIFIGPTVDIIYIYIVHN